MLDDLGYDVATPAMATRVVSLVPSLTEAIAVANAAALVGATDWCTHPPDLDVARVRGTKNPDLSAIAALSPDLVVANMEENRELDVTRLRDMGIPVWVTRIETVDDALRSMERLFTTALGWPVPQWLELARRLWAEPLTPTTRRIAIAIWRDPWMVVGRDNYTNDLIARLGCTNAFGSSPDRYPRLELDELDESAIDIVLLPDEPYEFGPDDGPEAFTAARPQLCSGRLLTWYGPAMIEARATLPELMRGRATPLWD